MRPNQQAASSNSADDEWEINLNLAPPAGPEVAGAGKQAPVTSDLSSAAPTGTWQRPINWAKQLRAASWTVFGGPDDLHATYVNRAPQFVYAGAYLAPEVENLLLLQNSWRAPSMRRQPDSIQSGRSAFAAMDARHASRRAQMGQVGG